MSRTHDTPHTKYILLTRTWYTFICIYIYICMYNVSIYIYIQKITCVDVIHLPHIPYINNTWNWTISPSVPCPSRVAHPAPGKDVRRGHATSRRNKTSGPRPEVPGGASKFAKLEGVFAYLDYSWLLVGGIPTPLKHMKVSWDYYFQYIWKKMFQTTNQALL